MDSWQRYQQHLIRYPDLGISLDTSEMGVRDGFLEAQQTACARAFEEMRALEAGAFKNPDEGRMVGHYWLRAPELSPAPAEGEESIRAYIEETVAEITAFAKEIHEAGQFTHLLVIGIGGSALGPQLAADALGSAQDALKITFFDNTDPDGFERVLEALPLASTLVAVISKSGGTKETANGMAAAQAAFSAANLVFEDHAVAVTGADSHLDQIARGDRPAGARAWRQRFAMTDWVGGRTSVTSVVGLLPMALQGLDIADFLEGAREMDALTRRESLQENAAMQMALMWHHAGNGRGERDMVILPYKDRLTLMAKYLQQLIMESLGKEHDLDGEVVEQGIAVYGNKGSTDQHAYVQQLRDGVNNFFATFIEVRENHADGRRQDNVAGDYLQGFLRGTRRALAEKGRPSMTISLPRLNAKTLGALIALYERAVGFYAFLVNINAYHQPGVEAGKRAAEAFISFLNQSRQHLKSVPGTAFTAEAVLPHIEPYTPPKGEPQVPTQQDVYHGLMHMAHNDSGITLVEGNSPAEDTFTFEAK